MVPTAITLSPSLASRAIDGSGSRSAGATGSSVTGSSTENGGGLEPGRRVAVLRHELSAVEHHEGVVRPRDRQPVGGQHLEVGAEAMDPAAEHHVQVAVRVCGDPPWPVRAAGQAGGGGGDLQRLRVEPLDPGLDRRRQRPAERHVVAQRVQLPGLAPHQHVGRRRRPTAAVTSRRSPGRMPRPGTPSAQQRRSGPPSSQVQGCGQ